MGGLEAKKKVETVDQTKETGLWIKEEEILDRLIFIARALCGPNRVVVSLFYRSHLSFKTFSAFVISPSPFSS